MFGIIYNCETCFCLLFSSAFNANEAFNKINSHWSFHFFFIQKKFLWLLGFLVELSTTQFSCQKFKCTKYQLSKRTVVQKFNGPIFSCQKFSYPKVQLSKSLVIQKFSCPKVKLSKSSVVKSSNIQKISCPEDQISWVQLFGHLDLLYLI